MATTNKHGANENPIFMADFETLTGNDVEETYVWASCVCSITNAYTNPNTLIWNNDKQLYEYLSQFESCECYFHNLKFDGQFILNYLLSSDFKYDEDLSEPNTYNHLITDMGQFYYIKVRWSDKSTTPYTTVRRKLKDGSVKEYQRKGKAKTKPCVTMFKDSLKKIPLPVRSIAKAYGLEMSKGDIDYTAYRSRHHMLTEEEIDYISRDVLIVAKALHQDIIQNGHEKLTASADAMNDFQNRLSSGFYKTGKPHKDSKKTKEVFRRTFPCLDEMFMNNGESMDTFSRKAYKGGWTYLHSKKTIEVGDGLVYDVNSLYPSVMYEKMLPHGLPVKFEGCYDDLDDEIKRFYPLYIQHYKMKFTLKKDHLPCIQIKGNSRFGETVYLESSDGEVVDLYLTNIDFELITDHYHVVIYEYGEGLAFKGKTGLFKNYIDHWGAVKDEGTKTKNEALRTIAKRMMNSLYGKFGTNPESKVKISYLNDEGILSYFQEVADKRESIYTPMACFVTAWARNKTIRSAQSVYPRFIYADTDSIHITGLDEPKNIEIDQIKLGCWKCEMVFHRAKYIRAKTYLESPYLKNGRVVENPSQLDDTCIKSDEPEVKCAGMPDNCKEFVTYDNFEIGSEFEGKLMPKKVRGGVVLKETTYKIKESSIF